MRLYQLFTPLAVLLLLLLSALVSHGAMARPTKTVIVYKSNTVTPYKYVRSAQGVGHPHRSKRKLPIYIVYSSNKIKLRHVRRLSAIQRGRLERAFLSAVTLSNGSTVYWDGNGASGSVRVVNSSSLAEGCRSYIQTVTINGEKEKLSGVACRQSDSSWKIVS